ncbi:MAG: ankyrin repeat domain-containing protein [Proteobacteria bacterium]|nr:ankyrin repeat domain-containing protein [Pseudomonadota bacterium]
MLNANQHALVQALKARDEDKILECMKKCDANFSFVLIEVCRVLTPLHRCVEDPKLVGAARELLNAGAKIEALDDDKRTPLISAAIKRCFEGVQLLLEWNANVHARDKYGCRAQEYASAPCDNPAMFQALQQRASPTLFMIPNPIFFSNFYLLFVVFHLSIARFLLFQPHYHGG